MAISYTKTTWADGSSGGTAIDAAKLNNIEDGIDDTVTQVNTNTSAISTLQESVSTATGSDGNLRLWRFGKVVFANITSGTYTAGQDSVLFTVPSGFRPTDWVIIYVGMGNLIARLDFGSDGKVYARTAFSNQNIRISACWLTS